MPKNEFLTILDSPEIVNFLFYPRKEVGWDAPDYVKHLDVTVHDGIRINVRLYLSNPDAPHIVFFHGNGEIAQDYDDVGQIYIQLNMNFMVVDYRGYGRSAGQPTVTFMLNDAHEVLASILAWLDRENRKGQLWVMGRSLGSAPAIELAAAYQEKFGGLIVESGFAETIPLLKRLGINVDRLNIAKDQIFSNADKIEVFSKPTLIIHAQYDQIIPLNHGEELFRRSTASIKKLYMVPGADHNTIMMMAGMRYFELIRDFISHPKNS